jgi:dipeptidyl aminopeptidase/acylaminoacyl peptidase
MVDFADVEQFISMRRITGLVASPDGGRLIVTCQEPDRDNARYVTSLWDVDPAGTREPYRLTWSEKGEAAPAFMPDGGVLFVSARPHPDQVEDESAVWLLPRSGEPTVYATTPGGLGDPVVSRGTGVVLAFGSRLPDSTDADDDKERRERRRKSKVTAIVHDGFPIRHWDHELNDATPRLFLIDGSSEGGSAIDLLPDAREQLINAAISFSDDGSRLALTWKRRRRGGKLPTGLALLGLPKRELTVLAEDDDGDYSSPTLSGDGMTLAAIHTTDGDHEQPMTYRVRLFLLDVGGALDIDTGDLYPNQLAWSADSATLLITGDLHGCGGLAVWRRGDAAPRIVLDDAVYSSLSVAKDGAIFALRSRVDLPPQPVRVEIGDDANEATVTTLPSPATPPPLPGRLERLTGQAPDGGSVGGWLCLPNSPDDADARIPVQVWIHGGPFSSHSAWSWRWCPWVAVARGYAVVMPDPGLSTGYGHDWLARGWPHRAGLVWADVEATLDAALRRPELDGSRVACLGGSFGGYMTNWIAGHTNRFKAIVTHAGLWALDQQHTTTDGAAWKTRLFGTPAEHPDWYAENSPHHFVDRIVTPMLVVHGNRDYRVPISEALRLWWDLVSRFDGEPADLPHRFLQFTGENHWILSPANAAIWWRTVQGFVDQHTKA